MICSCGTVEPFLVNNKCSKCVAENKPNRYIVRIVKDWYYDGGTSVVHIPAKRGKRNAKVMRYKKAAQKVADRFDGEVEQV